MCDILEICHLLQSKTLSEDKRRNKDTINVNYGTDFSCDVLADIALAKEGYHTEDGKHKLVMKKGIEVGNIFQLGYHYSNK